MDSRNVKVKHCAKLLLCVLLMLCPVLACVTYVREFLAIDAALDRGASWDYSAMEPDFGKSHPYIPFSDRHSMLLSFAICSFIGLILWYVVHLLEGRRKVEGHIEAVD